MNLFEISNEYLAILQLAEDPDVDPEVLADTMEGIEADFEDKADAYAYIIATLKGDAGTIDAELKRLKARKDAIENNADRLKKSLEEAMRVTGKTKFKTAMHSFGIQKNPQSVYIFEGAEIPDTYLIPQEPKVDKRAILADLKAGKKFDFAELQQTEGLRIR